MKQYASFNVILKLTHAKSHWFGSQCHPIKNYSPRVSWSPTGPLTKGAC